MSSLCRSEQSSRLHREGVDEEERDKALVVRLVFEQRQQHRGVPAARRSGIRLPQGAPVEEVSPLLVFGAAALLDAQVNLVERDGAHCQPCRSCRCAHTKESDARVEPVFLIIEARECLERATAALRSGAWMRRAAAQWGVAHLLLGLDGGIEPPGADHAVAEGTGKLQANRRSVAPLHHRIGQQLFAGEHIGRTILDWTFSKQIWSAPRKPGQQFTFSSLGYF